MEELRFKIIMMAVCATRSVLYAGILHTVIPLALAASMSILLYPVPASQINADEEINKELRLRIPGWCKKYNLFINGKKVKKLRIDKGYVVIADWNSGDNIELDFDMPVEVVKSDVRVKQNIGKRAIQRGPLVYCIEDAQNKDTIEGIYISPKTSFKTDFNVNLLNGVQQITAKDGKKTFTLIPYYAWDNMEAGNMKVWIDYKK